MAKDKEEKLLEQEEEIQVIEDVLDEIPEEVQEQEDEVQGPIMMECGHAANAEHNGMPCCAICVPDVKAFTIAKDTPDLTGRKAKCSDCGSIENSSMNLPFFEYNPYDEYDRYYCGCQGWD